LPLSGPNIGTKKQTNNRQKYAKKYRKKPPEKPFFEQIRGAYPGMRCGKPGATTRAGLFMRDDIIQRDLVSRIKYVEAGIRGRN
jgi:hypothetical protein